MIQPAPERMSSGLQVEIEHDGVVMLVRVRGELDVGTAPVLTDRVDEEMAADTHEVMLDLAEVTFFDSSAVRRVLAMQRELTDQQRHLVLLEPSAIVHRVLAICGLGDHFEVTSTSSGSPAAGSASA